MSLRREKEDEEGRREDSLDREESYITACVRAGVFVYVCCVYCEPAKNSLALWQFGTRIGRSCWKREEPQDEF